MGIYKWLEIVGTIFSLFFCILIIKENIWCWLFGILSSAISIVILYHSTLYSEAILAIYYIIIGFYGWYVWNKKTTTPIFISVWQVRQHLYALVLGIIISLVLGSLLKQFTPATNPFADAFIAIFSFIAAYKEARKILSSWVYWAIINGLSVALYFQRSLNYYAALTIVYTVLSVWGYLDWRKKYKMYEVSKF